MSIHNTKKQKQKYLKKSDHLSFEPVLNQIHHYDIYGTEKI